MVVHFQCTTKKTDRNPRLFVRKKTLNLSANDLESCLKVWNKEGRVRVMTTQD